MENAYSLWKKGVSGSHHVWGKIELEKKYNYNFILFPHIKYPLLNKLGSFFGIGYLDQQLRLIFSGYKKYILYLPYSSSNSKLILILKALRLYNFPIVSLIHQPFLGTKSKNRLKQKLASYFLKKHDGVVFLSEKLMMDTITILKLDKSIIGKKFFLAQWGPDKIFYKPYVIENAEFHSFKYFISAGHTDRDYETLIEAFRSVNFPLLIFCTEGSAPKSSNLPPNVSIFSKRIPYEELLKYYAGAISLLIPLKFSDEKEGCQGMTSIQDVVALRKPTIITKNPSLNLDVEKEGFGMMVNMFDTEGWIRALNLMLSDQKGWESMVYNAGRVFEEKFNSEIFAENLNVVFEKVVNQKVSH